MTERPATLKVFILTPAIDNETGLEDESHIASILAKHGFKGTTYILFTSKGSFIAIQILGEFEKMHDLNLALMEIQDIEKYEILGY